MPTDLLNHYMKIQFQNLLNTSQDFDLWQSLDLFCMGPPIASRICIVNVLLCGKNDLMNADQKQRT